MSRFCATHRMPRARIDPIDSEIEALSLVSPAIRHPLAHDTIAILLDAERRGLSILTITGTIALDAMFDVLEVVVEAGRDSDLGGLILATVRPDGGLEAGDGDRWLEANDLVEQRGIELVEWFVIADQIVCPRDMLGIPPKWGTPY